MSPETPPTPSLPKSLDLEAWIRFGLDFPDEVSRLLSLEELVAGGVPAELKERVERVAREDPAPRCRQCAVWALTLEKAKEKVQTLAGNLNLTPDGLKTLIEAAPGLAPALNRAIRKPPPAELLDAWRQHLIGETIPGVLEIGLSLMARFGRPEDADLAGAFLASEHPQVVCAALDVLFQQKREVFQSHLATALASTDGRVRFHALRLLRQFDPREAMVYLRALLRHREPLVRQRALRELLLVPFAEAEAAFLQFIALETRPLLLVAAGFGVVFNPHPDLPLKLFDIYLTAKGMKQHILHLLVQQMVETVQRSGILTESPETYLANLKGRLQARRQSLLVGSALRDLQSPEAEVKTSAIQRLRDFLGDPAVRDALKKRLAGETDPEVKAQLESLFEWDQASTLKTLEDELTSTGFLDLPLPRQRQLLGAVNSPEIFRMVRTKLKPLLLGTGNKVLLLEVLRLLEKYGEKTEAAAVKPLLQHPEKPVVAAAIKAMARLDADALLPSLNALLADDEPRIKAAALEVYLSQDKEGAIQYLGSMLKSTQAGARRLVLSLIPLLDYPSAEPLLMEMLATETTAALRIQAGYLIAANPSRDGLQALYRACHDKDGKLREGFAELWEAATLAAGPVLKIAPGEIAAGCAFEEAQAKEKAAAPAPDYAFQKVVGAVPGGVPSLLEREEKPPITFWETMFEMRRELAIALVIFSPVLWFVWTYLLGDPGSYGAGAGSTLRSRPGAMRSKHEAPAIYDYAPNSGSNPFLEGGIKSSAGQILGGSGYVDLLKKAADEQEKSQAAVDKEYETYYRQLSQSDQEDAMIRAAALAKLDRDLSQGDKELKAGNIRAADEAYQRVLGNSQSTPLARIQAYQQLMQISVGRHSKEDYLRYLDGMLEQLNRLPGMEKLVVYQQHAGLLSKLLDIGNPNTDPAEGMAVLQKLTGSQGAPSEGLKKAFQEMVKNSAQFHSLFDR